MPEIEAFMIEAALYHGFSEDSDNEDGVTDYRCSRAVLLKLMRACVKQGETNVRAQDEVRTVHIKLDKIIEQTKPKSFEIEIGPSLPPPSDLGMGYGASAALNQRVTELHKELYRVLDDKRKMYEPPTDVEILDCSATFGPARGMTGGEMDIGMSLALRRFVELRKASTTYNNLDELTRLSEEMGLYPKSKIAEPTEDELQTISDFTAKRMDTELTCRVRTRIAIAVQKFVELRNKD